MFNPLSLIGGLGLGSKIAIGMGVLLLATLAASAWYYKDSQNRLSEANQLIAAERAGRVSAEANLDAMRNDFRTQARELTKLNERLAENTEATRKLEDTFAEHDLNELVNAKPDLVQKKVNDATKKVLKELEDITNPRTYEVNPAGFVVPEEENTE